MKRGVSYLGKGKKRESKAFYEVKERERGMREGKENGVGSAYIGDEKEKNGKERRRGDNRDRIEEINMIKMNKGIEREDGVKGRRDETWEGDNSKEKEK